MPAPRLPVFTPAALRFLRALERNNRREWFHARREEYDTLLREPMARVVEQLAIDFRTMAPDLRADVSVSLFRPWRDTRFSADKKPLKTHVAAVFPHRQLGRMSGAGLYVEVAPTWVWMGGGLYAPDAAQLYAVRAHIAEHHETLAALLRRPTFRRYFGTLAGNTLSRVPRGFDRAHPAADWLRHTQFIAAREETAAFATRPTFYRELRTTFRALVPLIDFLNEPLLALDAERRRDPLAGDDGGYRPLR